MIGTQANPPPSDSGASRRAPLSHPLGDVAQEAASGVGGGGSAGLNKPRVKMLATSGDLVPAGATFNPPAAAPLPERGAGLHLLLSALAATITVVFLVLLLHKL